MKIGAYSPVNGNKLADDITGVNFGNVQQGKHSTLPVCIRPVLEGESITGLELYLQNNGGFNYSEYGYYVNSSFISDLATGGLLSDHFSVVSDPPQATGGVTVNLAGDYGDYIWLDVQAGSLETGGTSSINYRFIFEYA
ncbi:MAG: hypothetical protein GF334_06145 [Candidatus Altiarchaeales archaeon]|nr:hypothetical protein [Candidatus Altiarchaeales archaeon]